MIFDKSLLLSDGQAITATAVSTNVIDLGATGKPYGSNVALTRDIGIGEYCIDLAVSVTQAFNNLTSLSVSVQTSPDNATWTTVDTGETALLAALTAGYQFFVPAKIPEGTRQRYVRLNYTVTGTAPTTGAITAGVVASRQTNRTYGGA